MTIYNNLHVIFSLQSQFTINLQSGYNQVTISLQSASLQSGYNQFTISLQTVQLASNFFSCTGHMSFIASIIAVLATSLC